ncbi:hypothetical protein E2C01_095588 [Portunus trituberculatus]|uniref:Uncharacterized protein n=1 Tax=Portunus trituberculatus TaxID=210409 RepID=A0A5B7K651_PORTR|nr:hypothetical protein [Portunus trituberculatus]
MNNNYDTITKNEFILMFVSCEINFSHFPQCSCLDVQRKACTAQALDQKREYVEKGLVTQPNLCKYYTD